MRILGPCRSTSTPTARPTRRAIDRTSFTRLGAPPRCRARNSSAPHPARLRSSLRARLRVARSGPERRDDLVFYAELQSSSGLPVLPALLETTAGSFLPSRNSRNAPPPVEMYEMRSATELGNGGEVSPPPAIENADEPRWLPRSLGAVAELVDTRRRRPGRSTRSCPPCRGASANAPKSPARCRVSDRRRLDFGAALRFCSRVNADNSLRAHDVGRDRNAAAFRLQGRADLLRLTYELGLGQGLSDATARREQKRVRDAATDDQLIHFRRRAHPGS